MTDSASAFATRLPQHPWRTRFAPAPTGYLHLGHIVNAVYVWGLARAFGGSVALRIEDHDRTRCRREFETSLLDDLEWLGFMPDSGSLTEFRAGASRLRQSDNTLRYETVLAELESRALVYPCTCTRADIERAAGTVRPGTEVRYPGTEVRYPGTCATRTIDVAATPARRVRLAPALESFDDIRLGSQQQTPAAQCGDLLVRDRNGNYTYQFAVTVDDFDQRIDVIIRGEDLLPSTGRQRQLARLIGRATMPVTLHHPLLVRTDGIKLSKSLGDSGVRELREAGVRAPDVIGRAVHAAGLRRVVQSIAADDVASLFAR